MDRSNVIPAGSATLSDSPLSSAAGVSTIVDPVMKDLSGTDQLSRLVIRGYRSIAECDLPMSRLNVLIGANGAGKSNLISFFELIADVVAQRLQYRIAKSGGPDAILHFGRKMSPTLSAALYFGYNGYKFTLEPTNDNRMMFADECLWWNVAGDHPVGSGHFESRAHEDESRIKDFVLPVMASWRVYHFHDTGESAVVKQMQRVADNAYLRRDGRNLAAFLLKLKRRHQAHYKRIVATVRLVAPFFGDFRLVPSDGNNDVIELGWTERHADTPFKAADLSDGTLRFLQLATVLLQPDELMPNAIIIDEPELGLHPYAINVLADLVRRASTRHQIILSTQSVELVSQFDPEDLVVVDKKGNSSEFTRLNDEDYKDWLADYTLGERVRYPEDINDDPSTAPSKRIRHAVPGYQKTLHGPLIAGAIGIDRIRSACPHFRAWIERLTLV